MPELKENVLKLSKPEQYEIYEAIEANLFGQVDEAALTDEQMKFIEQRLSLIDRGKAVFIHPDQLKSELDNLLK